MEEGLFHLADLPVYSVRLQSFVRLILILSDDKLVALTDDTIFSPDIGEKEEDSLTMDVIMHLLEYARLELVFLDAWRRVHMADYIVTSCIYRIPKEKTVAFSCMGRGNASFQSGILKSIPAVHDLPFVFVVPGEPPVPVGIFRIGIQSSAIFFR